MLKDHKLTANQIRKKIIQLAEISGAGHIASGLSMVEIFHAIFNVASPIDSNNKLCLSKGHGGIVLYAMQNLLGVISDSEIQSFQKNGSRLTAFPTEPYFKGLTFSSGSLGHGLGVATGVALGKKLKAEEGKSIVVLSDGELQEGSIWEAIIFAAHHQLNNLICIIDKNNLQAIDRVENVSSFNLKNSISGFGWNVIEIDGHDSSKIAEAIKSSDNSNGPTCIICATIKGKGISFMENSIEWHYLGLQGEYLDLAKSEVEAE